MALALALAGALTAFRNPLPAGCALAFVVPLAPGLARLVGGRSGAPLLTAVALAVLGGALAGAWTRDERSLLPPTLRRFAGAFLVLAAGSAAASIARGETLYLLWRGRVDPLPVNALGMTAADRSREAVLTLLGLVLLLLALEVYSRLSATPEGRDRLLLAAAAGAAAAFVIAGVARFRPFDPAFHPWTEMHRRAGTFTDPNALGVGIGLSIPLLVAALARRGTALDAPRRGLALVALAAAPLALESSGSRTGLLLTAVIVLVGATGLARARLVRQRTVLAALAAAVLAGIVIVPALPRGGGIASGGLLQRLGAGLSTSSFAELANHRTLFWRTALEMTWDEPLSGVGLAGFPYEFPDAHARRHGAVGVTDSATNAFLEIAAECGMPGLALAIFAVAPLLARAWNATFGASSPDGPARAAGAALLGLAVACQTGSHLRFPEIGLLTGLVAGFLFAPRLESSAGPARDAPANLAHIPALLAAAGIVGAFAAAVPTLSPAAPFRLARWIGLYRGGPSPNPFVWSGPRACRRIREGETSVSFRVANARPDGEPVTLLIDVDGVSQPSLALPGASSRDLTVTLPPGAQVLRLIGRPTFVPHDLTGSADFRTLSFRLAPGDAP